MAITYTQEHTIASKHLSTLLLLATSIMADTLYFNNGATVDGKVTSQSQQTVTIEVSGKSTTYAMQDIKKVETFSISPPPPPPVTSPPPATDNFLKSGSEFKVKTITTLSTREHSTGHLFSVTLAHNIIDNGIVVVPAGATLYGSVVQSQQSGRLVGKSNLVVSLNAIVVDGKRSTIHTNKVQVMNQKSQTRNTTKKVARGAIIGGLINGNEGAKNGAKVGVGVAVLTKGEAISIPAGTLLSFTLTSDVKL